MSESTDASAMGEGMVKPNAIPIRNLWHMLLYAWNEAFVQGRFDAEAEEAPSLDALLARVLASLLVQRLRIGLGRGYAIEERTLRSIKGRIDFTESLRRRAFEKGAAHCRFHEYSANIPRNQIIRSTLVYLVQTGEFGSDAVRGDALRQKLRRLVRDMEGVDLVEVSADLIRRQHLGRNDSDYRLMLAICELVHFRQMPTETQGIKGLPGLDWEAMTLHRVFERFVANFYRLHLDGWEVTAQAPLYWHTERVCQYLPAMRADLVLRHRASGRLAVLDTKFTPNSLSRGWYGCAVFDSSHLYQIYAYLRSQEHLSEQHSAATGILLYPAVDHHLSEEIVLQGHPIRVETVDLATSWRDVEAKLLSIFGS